MKVIKSPQGRGKEDEGGPFQLVSEVLNFSSLDDCDSESIEEAFSVVKMFNVQA